MNGSYLCVWQRAQASVVPSHTVAVVSTRSITAAMRNSSSSTPPSSLICEFRWKPVATSSLRVGSGKRSPASCSTVKRSKGTSASIAPTTQSRHGHIERAVSIV